MSEKILALPTDVASQQAAVILETWGLPLKNYAYSSESKILVVPGAREVQIFRPGGNTSFRVPSALNPRLSLAAGWLKLDFFNKETGAISSKIYSTESSEVLSLPASPQSHQLALQFISQSLVMWQEVGLQKPQSAILKMASISDLRKSQAKVLKTWPLDLGLRNKPVWLVFPGSNSDFWLAEMTESYESVAGMATLKEGRVVLTQFSETGTLLSQKNINYPDSLLKLSNSLPLNSRFLSGGIYFDQQIIFSTGSLGGTTTVHLPTGEWTTQAALGSAYMCVEPQVIAEGDSF
jgi:hypothetical protein